MLLISIWKESGIEQMMDEDSLVTVIEGLWDVGQEGQGEGPLLFMYTLFHTHILNYGGRKTPSFFKKTTAGNSWCGRNGD